MSWLPIAELIDGRALLETAVAALIGAVGVTVTFSLAIYGATRFADLRDAGRGLASFGALALSLLGLLASIAAVVFGIFEMVSG